MKKPVTDAITAFLRGRREEHPGKGLLDRYLEHGCDLETQVNVAAGDSEPVAGKRATWDTGTYQYWNLRIPKNAYDEPEFKDYKLSWPLELHADGIGTTGWHWKDRKSLWVGFDFDAITGHAKGVGITDAKLAEVQRAAENLPYTEVRKSTGGKGIHLYTLLDGIPTANHTEHAALARCILGIMSAATGFDFATQIDCCGSIMWLWHRKMTAENQGLALLKPAEKVLTIEDLPANWKDHVDVVSKRRAKVRVNGLSDEEQDPFDKLASARLTVDLDETHKATIDELAQSGFSTVWVQDYHLLQTHTVALQMLMQDDDVRKKLKLKGYFITNSRGSNPAEPNCFAFPLRNGAWKVYRFGQGINEDTTWQQDGEGWTTCLFNHDPDFITACRAMGGAELADNKGYQFDKTKQAIEVARTLGSPDIVIDEQFLFRKAVLRPSKDRRLIMRLNKEKNDTEKPGEGWAEIRGGYWERLFDVRVQKHEDDQCYDNIIRVAITPNGQFAGVYVRSDQETWDLQPLANAKAYMQSVLGVSKGEAERILGRCIERRFTAVSVPFQPEMLDNRRWNRGAAQFSCLPAKDEEPQHPYWDIVLQHIGEDLDQYIRAHEWCRSSNIRSGADYLFNWIACLLANPFIRLPYLGLYGPEDSGKSIFHEAISLLVTNGVTPAKRALLDPNGFNGELENNILCYVEEVDLSKGPQARNRMKDWTTAEVLDIRRMRTDQYTVPNVTHWVQCANSLSYFPVWPGDSRMTLIHVPKPTAPIPKLQLLDSLKAEAPHFMATLKSLTLPKPFSRLWLPPIETDQKSAQADQVAPMAIFVRERCRLHPDARVGRTQLRFAYNTWAEGEDFPTLSHKVFFPTLRELTAGTVHPRGKVNIKGKDVDAYRGIELIK